MVRVIIIIILTNCHYPRAASLARNTTRRVNYGWSNQQQSDMNQFGGIEWASYHPCCTENQGATTTTVVTHGQHRHRHVYCQITDSLYRNFTLESKRFWQVYYNTYESTSLGLWGGGRNTTRRGLQLKRAPTFWRPGVLMSGRGDTGWTFNLPMEGNEGLNNHMHKKMARREMIIHKNLHKMCIKIYDLEMMYSGYYYLYYLLLLTVLLTITDNVI